MTLPLGQLQHLIRGRGPRRQALAIVGILLVAGLVRLPVSPSFPPPMPDEVFSWKLVTGAKDLTEVVHATRRDVHPPLHYLALWLWSRCLSVIDLTSLRSLSGVFGTATVLATFWYGTILVGDKRGASPPQVGRIPTVAAAIVALCPPLVAVSHAARMYALLGLLTVLCASMLALVQRDDRLRDRFGYFAFATSALYTHNYAIFLVALQASWLIGRRIYSGPVDQPALRRDILLFAAIAASYAPWIPWILRQSRQVSAGYWIPGFDWEGLTALVWQPLSYSIWSIRCETPWLTCMILGAALLSFWPWRGSAVEWHWIMLASGHVVLIALASSLLHRPIFVARYMVHLLPLCAVMLAYRVCLMRNARVGCLILGWAACCCVISLGSVHAVRSSFVAGEQRAVDYVLSTSREGDLLLVDDAGLYLMVDYYLQGRCPCYYFGPRWTKSPGSYVPYLAVLGESDYWRQEPAGEYRRRRRVYLIGRGSLLRPPPESWVLQEKKYLTWAQDADHYEITVFTFCVPPDPASPS